MCALRAACGPCSEKMEWQIIEDGSKRARKSLLDPSQQLHDGGASAAGPSEAGGGEMGRREEELRRDLQTQIQEHQKELEPLELELAQLRTKMSLFNVNGHAIGFDRHNRRIWCFGQAGKPMGAARMFIEDPNRHTLFCLDTEAALRQLMSTLLTRGEREGRLKKRVEEQLEDIITQVALRKKRETDVRVHYTRPSRTLTHAYAYAYTHRRACYRCLHLHVH
jgi:hypothetical protein